MWKFRAINSCDSFLHFSDSHFSAFCSLYLKAFRLGSPFWSAIWNELEWKLDDEIACELWWHSGVYHRQLIRGQHVQYEMRVLEIFIDDCLINGHATIDAIQSNVVETPEQWIECVRHVHIAIRIDPLADDPRARLFAETHHFEETWQMLGVDVSGRFFAARISQQHNIHFLAIIGGQSTCEMKWLRNRKHVNNITNVCLRSRKNTLVSQLFFVTIFLASSAFADAFGRPRVELIAIRTREENEMKIASTGDKQKRTKPKPHCLFGA